MNKILERTGLRHKLLAIGVAVLFLTAGLAMVVISKETVKPQGESAIGNVTLKGEDAQKLAKIDREMHRFFLLHLLKYAVPEDTVEMFVFGSLGEREEFLKRYQVKVLERSGAWLKVQVDIPTIREVIKEDYDISVTGADADKIVNRAPKSAQIEFYKQFNWIRNQRIKEAFPPEIASKLILPEEVIEEEAKKLERR